MNNPGNRQFEVDQQALAASLTEHLAGRTTAAELKPQVARHGIYAQRDGRFMLRIRTCVGDLAVRELRALAALMDDHAVPRAHLTTRQDVQLHGVEGTILAALHADCARAGFPMRGGGGNTWRNIVAPADSGLRPDGVLDVTPHAHALNTFLLGLDRAFVLPRKFKVGLADGPGARPMAMMQDLGLVAVAADPPQFDVFLAGGMGRQSAIGIPLDRPVPETDLLRLAAAVINLFHDHGNRQDRQHARLRFLLQDLGETAFRERFDTCFAAVRARIPKLHLPSSPSTPNSPRFPDTSPMPDFDRWRERAVHPTAVPEIGSVELLIPHGNVTPGQLRAMAELAREFADGRIRLSTRQTAWLRQVHSSALPHLHRRLLALPDDWTGRSFRGLVPHCVGTGVCPLGFLDSPALAEAIGVELDRAFAESPGRQPQALTALRDGVRISGCANACAGHPVAALGLQGVRHQLTDGTTITACQAWLPSPDSPLSRPEGEPVPLAAVPARIRDWLRNVAIPPVST
jgi:sulfite reductase beta subunit-like hemoprotein